MTAARIIIPGAKLRLGRSTILGLDLLGDDEEARDLFVYCLGVFAKRFGIIIDGGTLVPNQERLVITDVRGECSRFTQHLHRILALATQARTGWKGAVWNHEKTDRGELLTQDAVVEELAQCQALPVTTGYAKSLNDWRGYSTHSAVGAPRSFRAQRPDYFFLADDEQWPAEVTLHIGDPHAPKKKVRSLRRRVARRAQEIVKESRSRQKTPARRNKLLQRAIRCVGKRHMSMVPALIERWRRFAIEYRNALRAWCAGRRGVEFPRGTYWMRVFHGASIRGST